jgi:hypothetical protein
VDGVIVKPNGANIDEICCSILNGWYGIGPASSTSNYPKCYQCPPIDSGGYVITSGQVLFNGAPISQACCTNYSVETKNPSIVWYSATNRCNLI